MSTLVLRTAGRIIGHTIGFALGGPFGGFIGREIGGAIGAGAGLYLDARLIQALTPAQRIEGPLLDELRVTSATEGAVIPRVYGSFKNGGNIIWASDFRVEETTTEQGGKGSPSVDITERRYYASFAVGLCEGPIAGVGRIWADGKPFDVAGAVVRTYVGSETQEPDSWIEGIEGEGNVPAYRGVAYVVFEDLPLEAFGNRIPQLAFEVFAPVADSDGAAELITAVNMIPSAGEFVYATDTVLLDDGLGHTSPENVNSSEARPDILVSLDQLEAAAPNLTSVSIVVAWFGTDLRCGSCEIKPGVEFTDKETTGLTWVVNGISRGSAYLISRVDGVSSNGPNYGGTPSDAAVIQAIQELKSRGISVTFYPFILMDVPSSNTLPNPYSDNAGETGQAVFPWRGRITCSPAAGYAGTVDKSAAAATQVAAFFGAAVAGDFDVSGEAVSWTGGADWGLRRMILHYAHLCDAAGGVDAFLIGSEMRGLSQVRSAAGTYPAVAEFIDLAAEVRSIVGSSTEISYAADWSEYFGHQPDDGSGDVYFHLDDLWADAEIDFVGIDNYMPLSDWRDGTSHLDAQAGYSTIYDLDYLQANVEGGEGFDWYYASTNDRDSQTRTNITDATYGKPWVFRYKDIRSWWSNQHYNRPAGVESGSPTSWTPESKPFRFTEAGCPAVDKGTNQPNVFYDPKSSESFLPYYSRAGGVRDDAIQRRYIEALVGYWNDTDNNPYSSAFDGRMVHSEIAIWTWDARPFPAFPARSDVWADADNWRLGHWITGRLGGASLGAVVEALCARAGVDLSLIDASALSDVVHGTAVTAIESARASIAPLMVVYGFDAVESGGVIRFVPRGGPSAATVAVGDLVALDNPEGDDLELTRGQETELPRALKWRMVRADEEYGALTVEDRRITVDTARIASEQYAIAMSPAEADAKVRRALRERWIERESGNVVLPPSLLALDPTDVILLNNDSRTLEYRIGAMTDGDARRAELARTDAPIYALRPTSGPPPSLPAPVVFGAPIVELMDLPQLSDDIDAHRPYVAVQANPWYGSAAVYRSLSLDGFSLSTTVGAPAKIGETVADFYSGPTSRFDYGNELYVDLYSGTFASVTDQELFSGANTLAIESAAGVWEIVQFATAELIGTNRYKLTKLLRGQLGTESAMGEPTSSGARVVVLNTALKDLPINVDDLGVAWNWRVGPSTHVVASSTFTAEAFTPQGVGLRPYSPAHLKTQWQSDSSILLSWIRRTRGHAGDLWEAGDVPLTEDHEEYVVQIIDGATVVREITGVPVQAYLYTEADQTADWGSAQTSLSWRVAQVGALGAGVFTETS